MSEWSAPVLLGASVPTLGAAVLAAVLCGFVGTYVVLRRLVALGGGVAHASFGGIGLAVITGAPPLAGAAAVAVLSATVLGRRRTEGGDRTDATIGVLWAVGMAAGMLLLAGRESAGQVDVEGYLFGEITAVGPPELVWLALLVAAVLALHLTHGRELVAIAFDAEHAALQGIPVRALEWLLMAVVALSLVALLALVGVVLAIALLAIPPLVALRLVRGLRPVVVVSIVVALVAELAGLALADVTGWPAGPSVVLVAAALLAASRLAPRPGRSRVAAVSG